MDQRVKPSLLLTPHPNAPRLSKSDGLLVLQQLAEEALSGNFPDSATFRSLLAEAGLVSLWFFIKVIAGYAGPYDRLNDDLHVSMANFRQSCLDEGTRAAAFLPRGVCKTKIFTEGGIAWEGVRDGEKTFRISNQIADYATDFMLSIKAIYDSNELFAALYPHCVPTKNQDRWNNTEIVFPHRRKYQREASVETGGTTGSSESRHVDCHVIDDPIGAKTLNANRQSNAQMETTKNWFRVSDPSLLNSAKRSRVVVVGTRWAVDDLYSSEILSNCYSVEGYPISGFEPNLKGKWRVYYRKLVEDQKIVIPEEYDWDIIDSMAKKDWWTYVTQYLNDPQEAGLAEFINYGINTFQMDYRGDEWYLEWMANTRFEKEEEDDGRAFVQAF